ncbi:MAG: type II secretion system protein [Isosphaeraceae bacterium]
MRQLSIPQPKTTPSSAPDSGEPALATRHSPLATRHSRAGGERGFTLVELLVVMVILAILIALLLPAISGAMRTAKNAAIGAEENQLAQALADFKTKYGDYPPSRIYLSEDGNLSPDSVGLTGAINPGDITWAQLGQRSLAAMRKFFPRVQFNLGTPTGKWYDFNGNGNAVVNGHPERYVLQGHECLVFFLGGIPQQTATGFGMTGFGKDPTNPFTNSVIGNVGYSGNRYAPFFEFANNRLAIDSSSPYANVTGMLSGIPGYFDTTGNTLASGAINFYAYFSAYGSNNYDPNDVNFLTEADAYGVSPIGLQFMVGFPVSGGVCLSSAPNPYTSSLSITGTGVPTFLNPQTFQIISSGIDGQYGIGGQYLSQSTSEELPLDPTHVINTSDTSIRTRERDNVTNFHNGRLE